MPSPVSELREGQRVEHNRFGMGTLKSISGHAADMTALVEITGNDTAKKARIDFEKYGEKVLLLNYAKIRLAK